MQPTVKIEIEGPSFDAKLTWDGKVKTLTRVGNHYSAVFETSTGAHLYAVVAVGAPGEAWTATVTAAEINEHAGHMSPAGIDTTGDTVIHA